MNNFVLTNKAVEDLSDIWNYTYDKWSEYQADKYYRILIDSIGMIAKRPYVLGKKYDEILSGLKGYKVNRHIIFFLVLPSCDIEVIRILHESMDLPNKFK